MRPVPYNTMMNNQQQPIDPATAGCAAKNFMVELRRCRSSLPSLPSLSCSNIVRLVLALCYSITIWPPTDCRGRSCRGGLWRRRYESQLVFSISPHGPDGQRRNYWLRWL